MKIYTDIQQGTPEWLALRIGKFTASDAQAIANNGKGLETLSFSKVAEKMTGKPAKEEYTNPDMERGNNFEEEGRSSYEIAKSILVTKVAFVEKNEWAGCSPDGLIGDDGLLEIKCPNDTNFARYLYDLNIDPKYKWQMQMQMLICERQWCDFVVYNPNFMDKALHITRIERDEADIEKIRIGLETGQETVERILSRI